MGVITDGDIRRYLIRKPNLNSRNKRNEEKLVSYLSTQNQKNRKI